MRILLIHRYFWPDTPPYAAMLRSIAKKLVDDGHEVLIMSSQPSYKSGASSNYQPSVEKIDGMTVHRIALFHEQGRHVIFRLLNMIYFPLRILLFSVLKGKFDVIMASTAPPVVVGFAAALGSKMTGSEFFYHCMDIHPEIGRISGEFKHPLVFKILQKLDNISCRWANKVIVLSEDMKKSLLARTGYNRDNIQIINNFSMPYHGLSQDVSSDLIKGFDKFRVIFAGNVGRFQGLDAFVDAMEKLAHRTLIELVFVGEGSALSTLKKRASGATNIKFFPHQTVDVARKMIADSDLGIVSLSPEIYQYAYPSKTMTYLDEGCPLLLSVEHDSELAKFVVSSNIGVLAMPNSSQSIADAIESIFLDIQAQHSLKTSVVKISKEMFSETIVIGKWSALFHCVQEGRND